MGPRARVVSLRRLSREASAEALRMTAAVGVRTRPLTRGSASTDWWTSPAPACGQRHAGRRARGIAEKYEVIPQAVTRANVKVWNALFKEVNNEFRNSIGAGKRVELVG